MSTGVEKVEELKERCLNTGLIICPRKETFPGVGKGYFRAVESEEWDGQRRLPVSTRSHNPERESNERT